MSVWWPKCPDDDVSLRLRFRFLLLGQPAIHSTIPRSPAVAPLHPLQQIGPSLVLLATNQSVGVQWRMSTQMCSLRDKKADHWQQSFC